MYNSILYLFYFVIWIVLIALIIYSSYGNVLRSHYVTRLSNQDISKEILRFIVDKYKNEYNLSNVKLVCFENKYQIVDTDYLFNDVIVIHLCKHSSVFRKIELVLMQIGKLVYIKKNQMKITSAKIQFEEDFNLKQYAFARSFVDENLLQCIQLFKSKKIIYS